MTETKVEDQVTDTEGKLTPEEIEHKKLFEEFAARHRGGAAEAAAVSGDSNDEDEVDDDAEDKGDTANDATKADATAADAAAKGEGNSAATQDIWANATPEQKAAFDAATVTNKALEQYKRSNEGRINSFQRQIDDLNRALAGRAAAATPAAATAAEKKVDDASKQLNDLLNDPDFVAAEKEYPEVYKPQRKVIGGLLAMVGNLQSKAQALEGELTTLKTSSAARFERDDIRSESQRIVELDPDYVDVVSSPGFREAFDGWLQSQPTKVRELVNEAATDGVKDASSTSWAFRRFKADTGFGGGQKPAAGAKAPAAKSSTSSATDQTRRALQLDNVTHRSPRIVAQPTDKDGTDNNADALWRRNVERIKKRQREEGFAY